MKNYVVKALIYFKDKEEKKQRLIEEEFETTKERYEFLQAKGAVELVKIIGEEKTEKLEKMEDVVVEEIITKKKKSSKK